MTGLLLTYPVHQACDILFCKANVVPIGIRKVETQNFPLSKNKNILKEKHIFP